jgi:Heterokaryon incompatibility protein (HET)
VYTVLSTFVDDIPSPWPYVPIHNHIIGNTSSDMALELVKNWMANCKDHNMCKTTGVRGGALPTRTVFLGESNDEIKLSENHSKSGRYTCLSHCWGKLQPFQTQTHSIAERRQGISWNLLPKTFQDAVDFTRRLGVQHIWIDSLCIIQNDGNDWAHESAKMASIYANSYLTLAATASEDGRGGLFRTMEKPFVFTIQPSKKKVFAIQYTHNASFPLLRRGWVLQERLLSPRVLHFNKNELTWECNSETICECEMPGPLRHASIPSKHSWIHIVEQYTQLKLSNSEDKLPALSGIAQYFHSRPGQLGAYLAGLWENDLAKHLGWELVYKSEDIRPLRQYRAPTWSWASINSSVYYPSKSFYDQDSRTAAVQFTAKLLNATCSPSTVDVYGQVSNGYIEIKTGLIPARLMTGSAGLDFRTLNEPTTPLIVTKADFDFPKQAKEPQFTTGLYCAMLGNYGYNIENIILLLLYRSETGCGEWMRVGLVRRRVWHEETTVAFKLRWVELAKRHLTTVRII